MRKLERLAMNWIILLIVVCLFYWGLYEWTFG